ncbi:hypothetical protein ACP275_05G025100 [Erythranthe tilingii]
MSIGFLVFGLAILYFFSLLAKFLHRVWWAPLRTQYAMELQGIKGPSYKFIRGNIVEISSMKSNSMRGNMELNHDIFSRTMPHFYTWINIYGKVFYFWNGEKAELVITEPELVKEVLNKSESYSRTDADKYMRKIIGDGIVASEGEKWVKLRKLANQAFHAENLKNMVPAMVESVEMMMRKWREEETREVDISKEFTCQIITGRNAYKTKIPVISDLFKNSDDRESDKMEKEIQDFFLRILDQRKKETTREARENGFGDDYLGSLLRANHDPVVKKRISVQEIIDECKPFYSAGHATTSTLLSWTALLLAIDSEWQEKARQEVLQVFGPHNPNSEGLSRLKTMSMIINESLRLYPPVPINERKTTKTAKLGNLITPPNTKINMPILALHHDPAIWGDNAHLFKPERFSKGIAEATKNIPAAFSPFGLGPRTYVGMSFATNEAKIALCMILQRYKITLSPNYVHSPVQITSLRPQHSDKVVLHAL